VAVVALVAVHQVPTWRAEAWRFARASRNLRDREVTMGKTIGAFPGVERLLVATGPGGGATIAFAADRPAVDLVGVSAHRALPFHRAATQGAGATLELLERLGARDRPNVLVFDPDQWPEVAAIFGRRLFGVASAGNILTSSPELVAYRADWSSFDPSSQPHGLAKGERMHDELDVGDLLSEAAHGWSGAAGVVWWRVLPEVDGAVGEVFDGGRSLSPGTRATATLAIPPGGGRLVARLLASQSPKVHVSVAGVGTDLDDLALDSEVVAPSDSSRRGFSQASFALPRGLPSPSTLVFSVEGEAQLHHVWVVAASAR